VLVQAFRKTLGDVRPKRGAELLHVLHLFEEIEGIGELEERPAVPKMLGTGAAAVVRLSFGMEEAGADGSSIIDRRCEINGLQRYKLSDTPNWMIRLGGLTRLLFGVASGHIDSQVGLFVAEARGGL
jgi:hypothetical protein